MAEKTRNELKQLFKNGDKPNAQAFGDVFDSCLNKINDNPLLLKDTNGNNSIELNGRDGLINLGNNGQNGDLWIRDNLNKVRIQLDGGGNAAEAEADATIYHDGKNGNIILGNTGADGNLLVKDNTNKVRIQLDGGGNKLEADTTIYHDGRNGNIALGGNGTDGDLSLKNSSNSPIITLGADEGIKINNKFPIRFHRYSELGYNLINNKTYNTGYNTSEWNAAIVGFEPIDGDINERKGKTDFIRLKMIKKNNKWHILAYLSTDNNEENWNIDVMFVSVKLSDTIGY